MKFISPDINHRYIKKLALETLDIEFESDYKKIEESDRAFLIWNPYGYLAYDSEEYINKYNYYVKLLSQNRPAYIVERGALPNTIFIDRSGFLCESESYSEKYWNKDLLPEQKEEVTEYIRSIKSDTTSLEPQNSPLLSYHEFFSKLELTKTYKKVVFVPMQSHKDTVIKLWSDWVKDMEGFMGVIHKLAKDNPDYLFLVKNHPIEKDENAHFIPQTDNVKIADARHYKDCIKYCDVVVTINSGVGLQAMIWNKPVVIVGKAFYHHSILNYKANDYQQLKYQINKCKSPKWSMVLKFIYYLRFEFYSTCFAKKTGINSSVPVLFEKINYQTSEGEAVVIKKEQNVEPHVDVFFEFIACVGEHALMKTTCLDCINTCSLVSDKTNLHIAANLTNTKVSVLERKGYTRIGGKFYKDGIVIHTYKMPAKTKVMGIYGHPVNVPMPVVQYLNKEFGRNWNKIPPPKQVNTTKNEDVRVAQTYNLERWVFNFEALYYKKHSGVIVKPMLESDLLKSKTINVAVIPSAWHYRDLYKAGVITKLKEKGVKIVAQYNSEITTEIEHKVCDADLVVASSPKIYDQVMANHNLSNTIFLPHFVDDKFFLPENKYRNFVLGWTGNFKNVYKRPEIITAIKYPVILQKDYKESLANKTKQEIMPSFYNNIDVLLISSKSEGTPMPLLEAMACGKVVLSTDVGIASLVLKPEFIIRGSNDSEIIDNFNKKLDSIKSKKHFLIDEGKRNRSIVERYFAWDKNYHILDTIYQKLLINDFDGIKTVCQGYTEKLKCIHQK